MDVVQDVSAFEVYITKRKNIQPSIQSFKNKRNKSMQNGKISKNTESRRLKNYHIKNIHVKTIKTAKRNNSKNNKSVVYKSKSNGRNASKKKNMTKVSEGSIQTEVFSNNKITYLDKICSEVLNTTDETCLDPIGESKKLFEWLIYPLRKDEFFENNWEKTPLHIKRNKPKYYKSLMSTLLLDNILRDNYILFTKNLDITSFVNDIRETHNPQGRALPSVVWDYFSNGCSVRLLNPQTFIPKLHTLNAILQEFFGCFVGANSYLTPSNSQGFAPHYDDIEAFILQIEGKKRWRLYKPRNDNEFLPRYSSPNFLQKQIGKPILDTVVNAGDLLYFPRGTIHQGDTIGFDQHSLHITLSVYQKNSWGDFLGKLVPAALNAAIKNDLHFRKGLPINYLRYIGTAYSDDGNSAIRQEFLCQTKSLLGTLLTKYINIDKAADEMAKNHIHDFLPPLLDENESLCSVYEGGERMNKDGIIKNRVEIEPDTFIRLSRSHCARLVEESDSHRLYYSCDNSKEYHQYEPQYLEVDLEFVPAIKELIIKFPQYVRVEDLPINELDKKIQIVRDLWEKAIVVSKQPLPIIED